MTKVTLGAYVLLEGFSFENVFIGARGLTPTFVNVRVFLMPSYVSTSWSPSAHFRSCKNVQLRALSAP